MTPDGLSWYALLRIVHSYWRWAVLIAAVIVFVRSTTGFWRKREWTRADESAVRRFIGVLDFQFLLGVVLYFGFSPFWTATYYSFAETMSDQGSRFFGIEHQTAMFVAVAAAHIGRDRAKRLSSGPGRHRTVWLALLVFFVIVFWAIPWPWRPYRPAALSHDLVNGTIGPRLGDGSEWPRASRGDLGHPPRSITLGRSTFGAITPGTRRW